MTTINVMPTSKMKRNTRSFFHRGVEDEDSDGDDDNGKGSSSSKTFIIMTFINQYT